MLRQPLVRAGGVRLLTSPSSALSTSVSSRFVGSYRGISTSLLRHAERGSIRSLPLRSSLGASFGCSVSLQRLPLPSPQSCFYSTESGKVIAFNLADVGEGIAECEILKWFVTKGQKVQEFDLVCEVASDKATVEITSRYSGEITEVHYDVGDMARVGSPLISIRVDGDVDVKGSEQSAPSAAQSSTAESKESGSSASSHSSVSEDAQEYQMIDTKTGPIKVLATPAVRRIAKENQIDLSTVRATGRDGRVTKEDILLFLEGGRQPVSSVSSSSAPAAASIQVQSTASDVEIPIRGVQKVMVKTMTAANQVPHFGLHEEIVMDNLMELREQMKPVALKAGIKLTYMPFFIKACSLALRNYPMLNAHVNADCTTIIHKGNHNIGVAMDTPSGLLVPNIKGVQNLSILEIAAELNRLMELGKAGKLSVQDLSGGTFTLSNVGTICGTYARPVLFLPEVVIGAIGKTQRLPRFDSNGAVVPTNILYWSWSADHRVIDGATMARYTLEMKNYLEKPSSMLLHLR